MDRGKRRAEGRQSPPETGPQAVSDDYGDPIGYLVLEKGTPVVTTDGVTLGTVAKVQDNEREHIFDGLVVQTDDGRVFVDAPEVGRIYERRVELTVDSSFVFPPQRGLFGR